MKNVSYEYDRWVVETQLCKLRDTSDALIGRACPIFHLYYGVCELNRRRNVLRSASRAMFIPVCLKNGGKGKRWGGSFLKSLPTTKYFLPMEMDIYLYFPQSVTYV